MISVAVLPITAPLRFWSLANKTLKKNKMPV